MPPFLLPLSSFSYILAAMNTHPNNVRDYYNDIELHTYIALGLASDAADGDADFIFESEIEYRTMLLEEKFLEDAATIETDLRRCASNMLGII